VPATYDITPAARHDIRGIWVYTAEQWGERQADRYMGRLETCFQALAEGRTRSRSSSDPFPQVRVTRCQHHYVFYVHPEGQKPLVIAVLHERMDMLARLTERLSK
jgi:plasmid stabilization system protein ParE